jgi:tyrosine-specific transport protein
MKALNYAGFLCVILLLLLPALMSFFGRHRYSPGFIVPGGRFSQVLVIICSLGLLYLAI